MTKTHYDYVIVGGGSAGSVLANRLSDGGNSSVLVLEAGRSDYPWDLFIQMPAALTFPSGNPLYDWRYESDPEPHMGGRRVAHARGKVLGGSSSINGMIFQRGNPLDYERWGADAGMESWDFAHCLPYFNRMENALAADPDDELRGHDGPLVLERGPATNPLFQAFFGAAQEAGYPLTDDVNGYRQEGFAAFDRNLPASQLRADQPDRPDPGPGHQGQLQGQRGNRCHLPPQRQDPPGSRRRGDPGGRRHQHPAAAAALGRGRCCPPKLPRHQLSRQPPWCR
jgi:choline dehydrogenase